jgi:hypothetical protein
VITVIGLGASIDKARLPTDDLCLNGDAGSLEQIIRLDPPCKPQYPQYQQHQATEEEEGAGAKIVMTAAAAFQP